MMFKRTRPLWLLLLDPELEQIDFIKELQTVCSPLNFHCNEDVHNEQSTETGAYLTQVEQQELCLINLKKVCEDKSIKTLIQYLNKTYQFLGLIYVVPLDQWITEEHQSLSDLIEILKKFSKYIFNFQNNKIQLGLYLQNDLKQLANSGYLINLQNKSLTEQLLTIEKNTWQNQDNQESPNAYWEQIRVLLNWHLFTQKFHALKKELQEKKDFHKIQLCFAALPGKKPNISILKQFFLSLNVKNHYRFNAFKKTIFAFSLCAFLYVLCALAITLILKKQNNPLKKATIGLTQSSCDITAWQQLENWQNQFHRFSKGPIKATYYLFPIQYQKHQKTIQQQTQTAKNWINQCVFETGLQTLHQDLNKYLNIVKQQQSILASHEHAYRSLKIYLMAFAHQQRDIQATAQTLLGYALNTAQENQNNINTNELDLLIEDSLKQWTPKTTQDKLLIRNVRNQLIENANYNNDITLEHWWLINQLHGLSKSINIVSDWPDQLIQQFNVTVPISAFYTGSSSNPNESFKKCFNTDCVIYDWVLDKTFNISATNTNALKLKNWQKTLREQFNHAWIQAIENLVPKNQIEVNELSTLGQQLLFNQAQAIQLISKKIQHAEQFLNIQSNIESLFSNENKLKELERLGTLAYNSLLPLAAAESSAAWGQILNPSNHPITQFLQWVSIEKSKSTKPIIHALLNLITRPLQFALERIYTKHLASLNLNWQHNSRTQLQQIIQLYPFSDKGNDATAQELKQVLGQTNSSIQAFLQNQFGVELKSIHQINTNLQQALQWRYRIHLDPNFLLLLNRLYSIQNKYQESSLAEFEVNILPDPNFQEQYLTFEGQTVAYRNGLEKWHLLTWRGHDHEQGLRLHVVKTNGQICSHTIASGRMAWIKSLRKARIESTGNTVKISWPVCEESHHHLAMQYRHISGLSPSDIHFLNQWPMPNNVIKGLEYVN